MFSSAVQRGPDKSGGGREDPSLNFHDLFKALNRAKSMRGAEGARHLHTGDEGMLLSSRWMDGWNRLSLPWFRSSWPSWLSVQSRHCRTVSQQRRVDVGSVGEGSASQRGPR